MPTVCDYCHYYSADDFARPCPGCAMPLRLTLRPPDDFPDATYLTVERDELPVNGYTPTTVEPPSPLRELLTGPTAVGLAAAGAVLAAAWWLS